MATHDYVLDNASGAAFRTDLNNALAAIVSNNSNSSSPATTYAYQWWADTSAGVLKIRNSANNAWIELLQLDGTITLEDGSASAPGLAFRDDLDTGIFSSGADTFDIATAGVSRFQIDASEITFNETGADTDFRIESDGSSHMFFLDAGNNRIGINTTSPTNDFHILSGNTDLARLECSTTGTTGAVLILFHSTSSPADNDICGILSFRGKDDAGNETTYADIKGITSDVTNGTEDGDISFSTLKANSFSERMRLTSEGKLLIGTTTSDIFSLHVEATDNALFAKGSNTTAISLTFGASCSQLFRCEGSEFAFGLSNASPFPLYIQGRTNANAGRDITLNPLGGDVLIGLTTNTDNGTLAINQDLSGGNIAISTITTQTNERFHMLFRNGNGQVGSIATNGSATAFNTSSDYRLKENATAISDGITRLKTLKPYRFNFKSDASKTVDGFFAHEVTAVPEAITGTKDETQDILYTEEDTIPSGKKVGDVKETVPKYQGIDQSKIVPLLVAAVQELITKVETLEAA